MRKDFEDYLMEYFAENDGYDCLDDNLPDAFNDWLEVVDVNDIIDLANKWGKTLVKGD